MQRALELGAPIVAGGYIGGQLPRDASILTVRPGLQARIRSSMVKRFVRAFGEEAQPYFDLPTGADTAREIKVINPMLGLSVTEEEIRIRGLPATPRLVVITMAPLAARMP